MCQAEEKKTDAVAICILCGMALCKEHLVREELPVWEKVQTGVGETRRQLPATLPRFLCPPCYGAMHQAKK
jgi:hypothetical protein